MREKTTVLLRCRAVWSTVVASVKYTTSWQPPGGGSRRWCMGWGVWGGRGAQGREDAARARLDRAALRCTGSHLLDMLFVEIGRGCSRRTTDFSECKMWVCTSRASITSASSNPARCVHISPGVFLQQATETGSLDVGNVGSSHLASTPYSIS